MNLWTGLSALQASQFAIDQVSHNLANAGTEGYHRQEVDLQTRPSQFIRGHFIGSGVEVGDVRRIRSQIVESAFTNSIADLSGITQQLQIETRIESFLLPGDGSIGHAMGGLFDDLARLSANPGENTLRDSIVNQADNLALRMRQLSSEFVDLKHSVARQIELEVDSLNLDIEALVHLQNRIQAARIHDVPNDLLDQRDRLINSIAERIDIQRHETVQDQLGLTIAGSSISIGVTAIQFETAFDDDGNISINVQGSDRPIPFASGKLASLTQLHNDFIGHFHDKIHEFARGLIRQFDQAHAAGVGLTGPFSILSGIRAAQDINVSLNDAGLPFPIESGELHIAVTAPDGTRRISSIAIDPATDSMVDVAAKISSIDNIQATVDANTGRLTLMAATGYHFDFAGNLESSPVMTGMSGTSVPWIKGSFAGEENHPLTVEVVGSGPIGKAANLTARVTDHLGQVVQEINIGDGYEAGSPIDLGSGVTIGFRVGDAIGGDSFDIVRIANPDSTGILSALGLNSFFEGSDASDIQVRDQLLENSQFLATSGSGDIGDTRNLANLLGLREQTVLADDQLTFQDFLAETNAEIGFRVQSSTRIEASLAELHFQYQSERDAVSGVDINEELLYMTQYQKSYEAAVQVVRTMESMLDELFQIVR